MRTFTVLSAVLLALLFCLPATAQYQAEGLKSGVGVGVVTGKTDFEKEMSDYELGGQGRFFIRYDLFGAKFLQGDFGLGFGSLNNANYTTKVVPIHYRFILSPLRFETWNPYLYAGVGALYYKNVEGYEDDRIKTRKFTYVIPVGLVVAFYSPSADSSRTR